MKRIRGAGCGFSYYEFRKEYVMAYITIKDEFIKLGQALKLAGLVGSGIDAKMVIQNGEVTVNGEVDERRGRKLYPGDVFEYDGNQVEVRA